MFAVDRYKVEFEHKRDSNDRPMATTCKIVVPDSVTGNINTIHAVGVAFCNPVDQFSYNIGRKIALARALQSFPRDERAMFWQKYYQVRGGKW